MKKTALIIVSSALIFSGCTPTSDSATSKSGASIQPSKTMYVMAGKIEANDKADISSKLAARVIDVMVDVGSVVKAGDPLIKLDTKDIAAQVAQAQAQVATANANLSKVINGVRPEQIQQANASLDSAKASYDNANQKYKSSKSLYESGALSKHDLDQSSVALKSAHAQYVSAKSQLDILSKGETKETIAVYKAQVAQAQAALDAASTQLSNGVIVAPVSGVVTSRNINVGETTSTSTPVLTIVNAKGIYVNAYLPASLSGMVKSGQEVSIKVSEASDKVFKGRVRLISPVVDPKTKAILAKIDFTSADPVLEPGMIAEIGIDR